MNRYRGWVGFQAPGTPDRTPSGQPVALYEPVAGLESLLATVVALTEERRGERMVVTEDLFQIIVAGHRPQITTDMVAIDAEAVYDIRRVAPTIGRKATLVTALRVAI